MLKFVQIFSVNVCYFCEAIFALFLFFVFWLVSSDSYVSHYKFIQKILKRMQEDFSHE